MIHRLPTFACALVCASAIGAASTTMAAQPNAPVPAASRMVPGSHITMAPSTPGTLTALKGTAEVNLGTAATFNFIGSGHCALKLSSGDGFSTNFEGDLPFNGSYMYSSTTMLSYEVFKDYQASVTPSGNCKLSGAGPFTVKVRVNNPNAQSFQGTPGNTVSAAAGAKLGIAGGASAPAIPLNPASVPVRKP